MGIIERNRRLIEADQKYIWHPFTQMKEWLEGEPLIIEEGRDCFLRDIKGRWYLDGVSSLWVNIHGHRKREIDEAIIRQVERLGHSTLLGLGNLPSTELAERLVSITPEGLTRVFYSDNGSTAVEVALKMAYQYWKNKGIEGKNSFLALRNAYHGDTLGAVSVGGIDLFHEIYRPLLFETYKAPSPYCYRCELGLNHPDCRFGCLQKMEEILRNHGEEIAAIVLEPLVQGAGGMIVSPPGYLRGVKELAERYETLLIADEVAVGFGRTGRMFACEHEEVVPDFLCLSKGITGGYLPLAATLTTEEVFSAFLGEYAEFRTFFHGHSYTGNPIASAAAIASLDLFEKEDILEGVREKAGIFSEWLEEVKGLVHVGDSRGIGLMGGVELVLDRETKRPYPVESRTGYRVCMKARERGLIIRPLGDVIVIMPPLAISRENLSRMLEIIREAIMAVTEGR